MKMSLKILQCCMKLGFVIWLNPKNRLNVARLDFLMSKYESLQKKNLATFKKKID